MKIKPGASGDKATAKGCKPPRSLETPLTNPPAAAFAQPPPAARPKTADGGYENDSCGNARDAASVIFFFKRALPNFDKVILRVPKCSDREEAHDWYRRVVKYWMLKLLLDDIIRMFFFLLFALAMVSTAVLTTFNYNCYQRSYIPISLKLACPAYHMFHIEVEQPLGSTPWLDICVASPIYGSPERIPCAILGFMPQSSLEHGSCFAQTVIYRNKKTYLNPKSQAHVDVERTYFYHCDKPTEPNTETLTFQTKLFPNQMIRTRKEYQVPMKRRNVIGLFTLDAQTPPHGNEVVPNKTEQELDQSNKTKINPIEKFNETSTENKNTDRPKDNVTVYFFEFLFTQATPLSNRTGAPKNIQGGFQYVVNNGLESSSENETLAQESFEKAKKENNDELIFHTFQLLVITATPLFNHTGATDRVRGAFDCTVTYNGSESLDNNPKMAQEIFTRSQTHLRKIRLRNSSKTVSSPISETTSNNSTLVSTNTTLNRTIYTPQASIELNETSIKHIDTTENGTVFESEKTSKIQHIPLKNKIEVQIRRPETSRAIHPRWSARGGKRLSEFVDAESDDDDYDEDLGNGTEYLGEVDNTLNNMIRIRQLERKRLENNSVTLVSNTSSLNGTISSTPEASIESKATSNKNLDTTEKETDFESETESTIQHIPLKNELEVQVPSSKTKREVHPVPRSAEDGTQKISKSVYVESEGEEYDEELEKRKYYLQEIENTMKDIIRLGEMLRERLKNRKLTVTPKTYSLPVPDFSEEGSAKGNSAEI